MQVRTDFTASERRSALVWLSAFGLIGALIAAVYLGKTVEIAGRSYPFPVPIVVAPLGTAILTRTALLWRPRRPVALVPTVVWAASLLGFLATPTISAISGGGGEGRSIILLVAGLLGGLIPLFTQPRRTK